MKKFLLPLLLGGLMAFSADFPIDSNLNNNVSYNLSYPLGDNTALRFVISAETNKTYEIHYRYQTNSSLYFSYGKIILTNRSDFVLSDFPVFTNQYNWISSNFPIITNLIYSPSNFFRIRSN